MILRRPYAFLIKHFRFIHLVITAILFYLAKFSTDTYVYINSCISDQVNRYNSLDYINYNIYIFVVILILLLIMISWLFKYKDKPRGIYILSIIGYFMIGVYLFMVFGYFTEIHTNIIDQKVIRAYRDITLMTLGFQYIVTIIMLLRGLGFDIKKFNFTQDIKELNLTQEDAEEVEVDVNVDANVVMRTVRKQKREFGYFFQEYKVIILGILSIILFSVLFFGYRYIKKEFKVYNYGDVVGYLYSVKVNKGYFDIKGDKYSVVIDFDIAKYGVEEKFNVNNLKLLVDKKEYSIDKNICSKYDDLGNCYKKQFVTDEFKRYIVTYEVDELNLDKVYLLYQENYDEVYKIKLNLENYD